MDKHVFIFYGGAHHQSMRGWHNLYENDVEHIAGVLQQIESFGGGNVVACILQGPFTAYQRSKVCGQVMIRPQLVLKAMRWLKRKNRLYKELHILTVDELPEPIIIDDSELVESENTLIESRFEYTVVFPGTKDINSTNGGHMSQAVFRQEVLDAMDRSNSATIISRPMQNRLKDYKGDALLRAFPLQFPYGFGLVPRVNLVSNDGNGHTANIQLEYLSHLQRMSICHMHRGLYLCFITCMRNTRP